MASDMYMLHPAHFHVHAYWLDPLNPTSSFSQSPLNTIS